MSDEWLPSDEDLLEGSPEDISGRITHAYHVRRQHRALRRFETFMQFERVIIRPSSSMVTLQIHPHVLFRAEYFIATRGYEYDVQFVVGLRARDDDGSLIGMPGVFLSPIAAKHIISDPDPRGVQVPLKFPTCQVGNVIYAEIYSREKQSFEFDGCLKGMCAS